MERRPLGRSGLEVSVVGLGAGPLGAPSLDEREAEALLLGALDLGVTLLDTAPSYGLSEERIGRLLAGRRRDVVLSTKGGYGVPGVPDWTAAAVAAGIDRALARLRTDVLDVFHLHSCPVEVLARGDVLEPLADAVRAGKLRVAAYSGEEEALRWAIASGRFGAVQSSVSLCDQRALEGPLRDASGRGTGVLAKRPLANAPWREGPPPAGDAAAAAYRDRFRAMELDPGGLSWDELAVRFAAHAPGVDAILVGTRRLAHLARAVAAAASGPLPVALAAHVRDRFAACDRNWVGQV